MIYPGLDRTFVITIFFVQTVFLGSIAIANSCADNVEKGDAIHQAFTNL